MPAPLEFYFDFASPYSYLASEKIEGLAARHGRSLAFKPFLLGAVFKLTRQAPLVEIPLKGNYSRHDFARSARFADVPFNMPATFPIATVNAARAVLWLQQVEPALVAPFVHAAFRAYFVHGKNINDTAVLNALAQDIGGNGAALVAATQDAAIKDALKRNVDEAIARGVFGAPFIFVDGEPFWGHDRFAQIERWLSSGPF